MIYRRNSGPVLQCRKNIEAVTNKIASGAASRCRAATGRLRRFSVGPILGDPPRHRHLFTLFNARCRLKTKKQKGQ